MRYALLVEIPTVGPPPRKSRPKALRALLRGGGADSSGSDPVDCKDEWGIPCIPVSNDGGDGGGSVIFLEDSPSDAVIPTAECTQVSAILDEMAGPCLVDVPLETPRLADIERVFKREDFPRILRCPCTRALGDLGDRVTRRWVARLSG